MAHQDEDGVDSGSSSEDESEDDLAHAIASRVSQARLRRARGGAPSANSYLAAPSLSGYAITRASFRRTYERSLAPRGGRAAAPEAAAPTAVSRVELVDGECNTSDSVVTIERHEYQDLVVRGGEGPVSGSPASVGPVGASAGGDAGSAGSCGSNANVYLNIIVEDAAPPGHQFQAQSMPVQKRRRSYFSLHPAPAPAW